MEHPWLEDEEREALSRTSRDKRKLEKFTSPSPNWNAGVDDEKSPLFCLPKEDGLDAEICKELQFIRDSINLYRTLRLPSSADQNLQRPVFLPFLRRNLRYSNYVPVAIESTKSKSKATLKSELQSRFSKIDNSDTSIDNDSDFNDQDMSIKLISVKHNLLPAGHSASITFFYTRYSYKTRSFIPVSKIDSSTFIMDVKDDTTPVNIDLPPDLDFDESDPSDVFIILRVVFFDASKETQAGANRSLRNVPARLAGQCERAREAELKGKKPMRRMRESQEGDSAMFGAFQLTKTTAEGWNFSSGTVSLVLV